MLANVLAAFAQYERRLIGQRTKEALAAKREAGTRLGRPPALPPQVRERIRRMRGEGWSYPKIADALNFENVPTAHGGSKWHPATIRKIATAA
jgi:DNA invertase Pin-like site-specific DNA recombinase